MTGDGEPDWTPDAIDVLEAIPNYYLLYYYETDRGCATRPRIPPGRRR